MTGTITSLSLQPVLAQPLTNPSAVNLGALILLVILVFVVLGFFAVIIWLASAITDWIGKPGGDKQSRLLVVILCGAVVVLLVIVGLMWRRLSAAF
jgi:purine-cytosine permease-like protein